MTVDPEQKIRVIVACDHPGYRASIAALLDNASTIEVLAQRPEGLSGAAYVREMAPDALVLGVDPEADCTWHAEVYVKAFDGPIVGFALESHQRSSYRAAGVEAVVDGSCTISDLVAAIEEADAATRGR